MPIGIFRFPTPYRYKLKTYKINSLKLQVSNPKFLNPKLDCFVPRNDVNPKFIKPVNPVNPVKS